jgi:hypothetical protein
MPVEREAWGRSLKRTSEAKAYGVVALYGTTKVVPLTKGVVILTNKVVPLTKGMVMLTTKSRPLNEKHGLCETTKVVPLTKSMVMLTTKVLPLTKHGLCAMTDDVLLTTRALHGKIVVRGPFVFSSLVRA